MDNYLEVCELKQFSTNDYNELSAVIDGDRIFFRAPPHIKLECRGEPFVGIALLEAMVRDVNIRIEDSMTVSSKLHRQLTEIQSVYTSWNESLREITIEAYTEPIEELYSNVGCFWSAGVDSSHTLLRNLNQVTHLIMLGGIEVRGNTSDAWRQSVENQSTFCRLIGKELIPIKTNAKQWIEKRKISWSFAQGLVLGSMGSLFRCKQIFIGASHTYSELFPWGSHPLTDPMWSTESTELIHYGAIRRSQKIIELSKNDHFLNNLQVCWNSPHHNCGECSKCIRTSIVLFLLNISSKALPELDNLDKLKIYKNCRDESGLTFLEDLMILARDVKNPQVHKLLKGYYRRYKIREIFVMIDGYMLGSILKRMYWKLSKASWLNTRVKLKTLKKNAWD